MAAKQKLQGPTLYERDEHGLLKNADYSFNEDGSVDWRSMIKPEFLYIRKEWFERFGKEVPDSPEGLEDNQLAIMLGGIKELAKLRGFVSVEFPDVRQIDHGYVVASCKITWIGNYETGGKEVTFQDYANATEENTSGFGHKFLETIACNRAFVRCVRNFLNIHIVGLDELDNSKGGKSFSEESDNKASFTPTAALEKVVKEKLGATFEGFKQGKLKELWKEEKYRNEDAKNWNSFSDIPVKEARQLLDILKSD